MIYVLKFSRSTFPRCLYFFFVAFGTSGDAESYTKYAPAVPWHVKPSFGMRAADISILYQFSINLGRNSKKESSIVDTPSSCPGWEPPICHQSRINPQRNQRKIVVESKEVLFCYSPIGLTSYEIKKYMDLYINDTNVPTQAKFALASLVKYYCFVRYFPSSSSQSSRTKRKIN